MNGIYRLLIPSSIPYNKRDKINYKIEYECNYPLEN